MKKVAIDFDSTLSRSDVQSYVRDLIKAGIEVWIVTSRYERTERYTFWMSDDDPRQSNQDLFAIAHELGIPKHRVIFTNMEEKYKFFSGNHRMNFVFHLDDDFVELEGINSNTNVRGISSLNATYRQKCNNLLGL